MDDRIRQYLGQSLGIAGVVVLEKTLAYTLRPDLWPAGIVSCGGSFNSLSVAHLKATGARLYRATLEGRGEKPVLVAARSPEALEKRLEWVTGLRVTALEEDDEQEPGA